MNGTLKYARFALATAALLLVSCTDSNPQPTGPNTTSRCCECACSQADGLVCASVTVEGDESVSCNEVCDLECASHADCTIVAAVASCAVGNDPQKGDIPGGECAGLDQELDNCEPPSTRF